MSTYREQGVVFNCGESRLVGIAAIPEMTAKVGVLILVGGPQYRVGSHRQFTLLARSLAEAGIASFRFDFTGMGDSEGRRREFSQTEGDIASAIDAFLERVPGVSRLVLWGLCDAASSAMMFAHCHPQVTGMILLNPWVHSGEYSPEVKLAHFYRPLLTKRNKWRRLMRGKKRIVPALRELGRDALALIEKRSFRSSARARQPFVQDMLKGLRRFKHGVMIVLSENDLTASEFSSLIEHDPEWDKAISNPAITLGTVLEADHTFSKRTCSDEVSRTTIEWVQRLEGTE